MKKIILLFAGLILTVITYAQSYNFNQAIESYNAKDYDNALDYLNRDLIDNPKCSESYCYLAMIYFNQDKNAEALSNINTAIKYAKTKKKVKCAYNYYVRANIYTKIQENQKAIADLTLSIKYAPTDPDYLIKRAGLYVDTEAYDKGEVDYKSALKINEGEIRVWTGIGRSYYIQKRYDDANKTLSKLIKLSPDYPFGYYYKALVDFAQKNFDLAIEDIFNTLKLDSKSDMARKLFLSYCSKNYPLSLSKLNAQLIANPQEIFWYLLRAEVLQKKEDFLSAIADYNKTIELSDDSNRPIYLSSRASCYVELGHYLQAKKDCDESLLLDSTQAYCFALRGDVKRLMGNYFGAVEDLTKSIAIEPNQTWFYYRRGWVKDEFMKDTQGGLSDYNQAIAVDKDFAYTYLNRGRLYEKKLNDTLKAKADFTMILSLDTVVNESGNCRQYALLHLRQIDKAIGWSNKIIESYPTSGNYYDAACLYSLMNKPTESITNLKYAFENGYSEFIHLSTDDDLDNVRNLPEFKALVEEWQVRNDKSKISVENVTINEPKALDEEPESVILVMKNISSGTYEIKCQINELPLNFLFDTGASDISISQTEVDFMLKNGFLDKTDVLGSQNYQDANGNIEVGTKIMLRKVNLGGFILRNVAASVVLNKKAPLLIGQSALGKYGKIIIDNDKKTITISHKRTTNKQSL